MRHRSVVSSLFLVASASLLAARVATAQAQAYEFTGKVVCGPQTDSSSLAVVRGFYATSVNVRNPPGEIATVRKSVVWTFPTERRGPEIPVAPVVVSSLRLLPGQGFTAECGELDSLTKVPSNRFREGLITIISNRSLDVIGVYTAANLVLAGRAWVAGQVSTMHIDRFPQRIIAQ